MTEEHAAIARRFGPAELEPLLGPEAVTHTIVVQGAALDVDTDDILVHAEATAWVAAVVAWLDLETPAAARARLNELVARPLVRGVRPLIHQEPDPHWILRDTVLESLEPVAAAGLLLELPVVWPRHLADVAVVARTFPGLTIVIDHLGKPPLGTTEMALWATELGDVARLSNVCAKISGLNTATALEDWSASDLVPAVEVAVECFGPERLLVGSDWPVCLLNGDYGRVWRETLSAIDRVAPDHRDRILGGTARSLYRIDPQEPDGSAD